ncbi:MAG: DUF433 domain-containing protein [Acidobacteriota bacterium]
MSNAVADAVNSEVSIFPRRTVESAPVPNTPIQQDPKKLGGHPTIGAVRMQADVLINYLASGSTIDEFLDDYDGVTKEEALAVLGVVKQAILDGMLTGIPLRDENTF